MHGLGRAYPFLIDDVMRADDRRKADLWRRLHRMPDAPPPPPDELSEALAAHARRVVASWIGRSLASEN
jgi:hypothetical protein